MNHNEQTFRSILLKLKEKDICYITMAYGSEYQIKDIDFNYTTDIYSVSAKFKCINDKEYEKSVGTFQLSETLNINISKWNGEYYNSPTTYERTNLPPEMDFMYPFVKQKKPLKIFNAMRKASDEYTFKKDPVITNDGKNICEKEVHDPNAFRIGDKVKVIKSGKGWYPEDVDQTCGWNNIKEKSIGKTFYIIGEHNNHERYFVLSSDKNDICGNYYPSFVLEKIEEPVSQDILIYTPTSQKDAKDMWDWMIDNVIDLKTKHYKHCYPDYPTHSIVFYNTNKERRYTYISNLPNNHYKCEKEEFKELMKQHPAYKKPIEDADMETSGTTEWKAGPSAVLNKKITPYIDIHFLNQMIGEQVEITLKGYGCIYSGKLEKYGPNRFRVGASREFIIEEIEKFSIKTNQKNLYVDYPYKLDNNYDIYNLNIKEFKGWFDAWNEWPKDKTKIFNMNKEKKEMSQCKKVEENNKVTYTICAPGANKHNVSVIADMEERKVTINFPTPPTRSEGTVESQKETIPLSKRYSVEKTKVSILDGVITVEIPVEEGVIKTIDVD